MSNDITGEERSVAFIVVAPQSKILNTIFGILSKPEMTALLGPLTLGTEEEKTVIGELPRTVKEVLDGLNIPQTEATDYLSRVVGNLEAQILDSFVCAKLLEPGTEQQKTYQAKYEAQKAMLVRVQAALSNEEISGWRGENGWKFGPGGPGGFRGFGPGGPQPHG